MLENEPPLASTQIVDSVALRPSVARTAAE